MKLLASVVLMSTLVVGCDNTASKLEGKASAGTAGGDAGKSEVASALRAIDDRLKKLETSHTPGSHAGGTAEVSVLERVHRLEASLARREEALGFLEMAYTQQKRQQEAQEANEQDPDGVFAVDVSKAVAAGQIEGPSSAMVTIVEAWDFA
ncbi:MAG: hypothetical protein H0V17_02425 [Deltaproteobacteria bacterium]|nr:hypothetical protein [Deltaproteobacteria bacterium]